MIFTQYRNSFRWVMIAVSFILVSFILWETYQFFQHFKEEERIKMENWSFAQIDLINSEPNSNTDLAFEILNSNTTTPIIEVQTNGVVKNYLNIDENKIQDSVYVQKLIEKFKKENPPIPLKFDGVLHTTIYGILH